MASMVPRWYENKQRKPKQNRCSNNEQFQMWIISLGILRRPFDSLLIFSLTLRARCSRIWLWWWWLCVLWIYECLNQRRRVFSLFLRLFVFSSSHRLAVWCFQFTEVIVSLNKDSQFLAVNYYYLLWISFIWCTENRLTDFIFSPFWRVTITSFWNFISKLDIIKRQSDWKLKKKNNSKRRSRNRKLIFSLRFVCHFIHCRMVDVFFSVVVVIVKSIPNNDKL